MKKTILLAIVALVGIGLMSGATANEYLDADQDGYSNVAYHQANHQPRQQRRNLFSRIRENTRRTFRPDDRRRPDQYQRGQQYSHHQTRRYQYRRGSNQGYYNQYRQNRRYGRYPRGYYNQHQQPRQVAQAKPPQKRFSDDLCASGEYVCITVKRGQTWKSLFPHEYQRDLVKRLNRVNIRVWAGQKLALPKNLEKAEILDIAPLDRNIDTNGKKLIVVNLPKLAWAAYNENGDMVHWGPASGGKDFCPDVGKPCNTISGVFSIFNKKSRHCRSNTYPGDYGSRGAPMPYCMFFHKGFSLHGSNKVPGYHASHGCVRMYTEDAKWLNEQFVELPMTDFDKGTEIIVTTVEPPEAYQDESGRYSSRESLGSQDFTYTDYDSSEQTHGRSYGFDRDDRRSY